MKRNLFIFSSWVMLIVSIAAAVLWVVSYVSPGVAHYYWVNDRASGSPAVSNFATTTSLACGRGRIGIGSLYFDGSNPNNLPRMEGQYLLPDPDAPGNGAWNHLGFAHRSAAGSFSWGVSFPIWLIHLLALPLPIIWLMWRKRHQKVRDRRGEGLCLACGYDLRGSEDRCPECGKLFLSRNRPEALLVSWAFGLSKGQGARSQRRRG